jgi:RHS repeat-associated protein
MKTYTGPERQERPFGNKGVYHSTATCAPISKWCQVINYIKLGYTFLFLFLLLPGSNVYAGSCGALVFLEFKNGETNMYKFGVPGLLSGVDAYNDLNIYRSQTLTVSNSLTAVKVSACHGTSSAEQSTIANSWPLVSTNVSGGSDPFCATTPPTVSISGTKTLSWFPNTNTGCGVTPGSCSYTASNANGSLVWVLNDTNCVVSGDPCTIGETATQQTWDNLDINTYQVVNSCNGGSGSGGGVNKDVLTNLYTTPALVANLTNGVLSNLGSAPWSCSGGGTFNLSHAGVCGSMQASKFRYKYLGPQNEPGDVVLQFSYSVTHRDTGTFAEWTEQYTTIVSNHVVYTGHVQVSDEINLFPQLGADVRHSEVSVRLINEGGCGAGAGWAGNQVEIRNGPFISFGLGDCSRTPPGFLFSQANGPSSSLATAGSLEEFINLCRVDTGGTGGIRQYVVDGQLAQVEGTSSTSYTVSYYSSAGTLDTNTHSYSPTGLGTVYTVSLITSTPEYRLRIASSAGTHQDLVNTNGFWYLDNGEGYFGLGWSGTTNASGVVTNSVYAAFNTNGQVTYSETTTFSVVTGINQPLISTRITGLGSESATNYWFYNLSVPTTNINYGKLSMIVAGNGYWERYEYNTNGQKVKSILCLGNASTNAAENTVRVEEYDYSTNALAFDDASSPGIPRVIYEKYKGTIVGLRGRVPIGNTTVDIDFLNPATSWPGDWTEPGHRRTWTEQLFYTNGTGTRILYPDETVALSCSLTNAAGTYKTNLYVHGITNASPDIADGEMTVTVSTLPDGKTQAQTTYDIVTSQVVDQQTYTYFGTGNKSYRVVYLDGTTNTQNYDCCRLQSSVDRDGITTDYIYDNQKRQLAATRLGITLSNVLDSAGNVIESWRFPSNGSPIRVSATSYDTQGRIKASTDALGGITTNLYTFAVDGRAIQTVQNPDGTSRQDYFNKDGTADRMIGSAVFPLSYTYDVDTSLHHRYTTQTKLDGAGTATSEWSRSYTDEFGRGYKTEYAAAPGQTNAYTLLQYSAKGQTVSSREADGNTTYYECNAKGERTRSWLDMDGNGVLDSTDRSTVYSSSLENSLVAGEWVRRQVASTENVSSTDNITEVSLDGLRSWNTSFGLTSKTVRTYGANGRRSERITSPSDTYVISTYDLGRLTSITNCDANGGTITATSFAYDGHGRRAKTTDLRNGTTAFVFDSVDRLITVTNPAPSVGQSAPVLRMYYDARGHKTNEVQPDGSSVFTSYYPNGLAKRSWGSRTYPVEYTYDAQGRMTNMMTWQNFAADSGKSNTRWIYDQYQGFLTAKRYNDGQGPTYTNTPSGRVWKRVWARGVTTTYTYNAAGQVTFVDYSDSTPDTTYAYDLQGYIATNTWGTNILNRVYRRNGALRWETLNGITVSNVYDAYLRRTNVSAFAGGPNMYSASYSYTAGGQLDAVTDGTNSATYSYLANSLLVQQIVFKQNGTNRMTTGKTYDYLNRLTGIQSVNTQQVVLSSFGYAYNAANQRTSITNADLARWVDAYDSLGQLTSGKKYWNDGAPVAGQQFEYGFDDIGNRTIAGHGGDQNGGNLRYERYTANNLNQYSQRTVPGYAEVIGAANSNALVTVNNQSATRKGDYYRTELALQNGSSALYPAMTNAAVLVNGTNADIVTNAIGALFLPKTPEIFGYDQDGNLTNDGRWSLTWDGENRLLKMESLSGAPSNSIRRLNFGYDSMGRRISKSVDVWTNGSYSTVVSNAFVYDGWNCIAELNATNRTLINAYTWGTDLSGTLQGAGGVGGLVTVKNVSLGVYAPAYDGNGNVLTMVDWRSGTVSASYEYGPFGEAIRATGTAASMNPFRFSTKYQDEETDLLYYGCRYYNSTTGRWPSRDPIGERGGVNSYSFVDNDPLSRVDVLGRWGHKVHYLKTIEWSGGAGFGPSYAAMIGESDIGTDSGSTSWWPIFGQEDRHLNFPSHYGQDSRDYWYDTEFATAVEKLKAGDKEQNGLRCVEAAEAFGRGLHSRQDSSAHRSWPGGGDWEPWIAHPGWWDAWDDDDLRDIYGGFLPKYPSEEFWRNWHAHNSSQADYDTFVGFAAWPGSQQEASQIASRQKVVTQSHEAIAQFVTAVRKTCFCRKEMLFRP